MYKLKYNTSFDSQTFFESPLEYHSYCGKLSYLIRFDEYHRHDYTDQYISLFSILFSLV